MNCKHSLILVVVLGFISCCLASSEDSDKGRRGGRIRHWRPPYRPSICKSQCTECYPDDIVSQKQCACECKCMKLSGIQQEVTCEATTPEPTTDMTTAPVCPETQEALSRTCLNMDTGMMRNCVNDDDCTRGDGTPFGICCVNIGFCVCPLGMRVFSESITTQMPEPDPK